MSDTVISVKDLSKSYTLKHEKRSGSYVSLRDVISDKIKSAVFKKNNSLNSRETFFALKDVSFEINKGDRVGIIGRNGAGKSTLLKILSRIVSPTTGEVILNGRVASLLEVGTGFHPELTGRENVFLNGSILGMSRKEIQKKFDEIVEFAEVEKFLDTPVKRYSSGMYVRLAFAVAAHLEPEILIVDEVLAVGDAEFQKKCLGKMKDVSGKGRTVLFVSHNMAAIQNLCDQGIYLRDGQIQCKGKVEEVVPAYLRASSENQHIQLSDRKDRDGSGLIHFESVELLNKNGEPVQSFQNGKDAIMRIHFSRKNNQTINNLVLAIGIDNNMGQRVTHLSNEVTDQIFSGVTSGTIDVCINDLPLKQGNYSFVLFSKINNEIADWIQEAGSFHVEEGDFYRTGKLPPEGQGDFYTRFSFQLK